MTRAAAGMTDDFYEDDQPVSEVTAAFEATPVKGKTTAPQTVTGYCAGGPLDGRRVTVRSTSRFLAADQAAGKAWAYERRPDGSFIVCTDHDNTLIYPQGPTTGERTLDPARLWDAGENSNLPIIAVESPS